MNNKFRKKTTPFSVIISISKEIAHAQFKYGVVG